MEVTCRCSIFQNKISILLLTLHLDSDKEIKMEIIIFVMNLEDPGASSFSQIHFLSHFHLRFKEIKMKSIIREIILYILFLNIVMLIAFGDRDPQAFYVNKSMKDAFVEAHYHGLMKFTKVQLTKLFIVLINCLRMVEYWYGPLLNTFRC